VEKTKELFSSVVICEYEWNGQKKIHNWMVSKTSIKNVKKLPVEYVANKKA
jgi:hypothetical protein